MKKLVLVDMNNQMYQVLFSSYLFNKYKGLKLDEIDEFTKEELFRDSYKMILQKMFNILKFNKGYSVDILYSKDGRTLWRRDEVFSEYKGNRKKNRDESPVDFKLVYEVFGMIWDKLKETVPFRFIEMDYVETDDVIYRTIMKEYDKYDKFQIMSTDQDFYQLLKHDKVEVYNPTTKKFIEVDDSRYELFEKIITGDKSDWIPNILSSTRNVRQSPIYKTNIKKWFNDRNEFLTWIKEHKNKEIAKHFKRNRSLIDFDAIPAEKLDLIDIEICKDRTEFDMQKLITTANTYDMEFITEKLHLFEQ